jgi:flavodoxin
MTTDSGKTTQAQMIAKKIAAELNKRGVETHIGLEALMLALCGTMVTSNLTDDDVQFIKDGLDEMIIDMRCRLKALKELGEISNEN